MGVNKVVAKFCANPTPFRDHHFGVNQLTHGLSFLQSARTGRECYKPGLCKEQRPRQLRNNVAQNGHKMVPIINESIILKLRKKVARSRTRHLETPALMWSRRGRKASPSTPLFACSTSASTYIWCSQWPEAACVLCRLLWQRRPMRLCALLRRGMLE